MTITTEYAKVPSNQEAKDVRALIDQLDLGPIKIKLMDEEEGVGLTRRQVDEVEKWYIYSI